ncbi:hypothetical protein BGZ95_004917 [Linnemannia exigua]|uniref:Uncharacterized protein n=1 Tax=Linnemannia exigua TaxID=604196 RepID=A0AAD4DH24_9FUNG|nr:hypothetical protein BGZ95_004917 [Linnemannia exigua]
MTIAIGVLSKVQAEALLDRRKLYGLSRAVPPSSISMGSTLFFKVPTAVEELGTHFEDFADMVVSDDSDDDDEEEDEDTKRCRGDVTRKQQSRKTPARAKVALDVCRAARCFDKETIAFIQPHTIVPSGSPLHTEFDGRLVMSIIRAMPEQQLKSLTYERLGKGSVMMAMLTQRHTHSIRIIRFDTCQYIASKVIQSILVDCQGLEHLAFNHGALSSALSLADAVEVKWGATRLKTLHLMIALGDLKSLQVDDPYYTRPAPVTFDEAESTKMAMLERLYTQIGELTHLEQLGLSASVDARPCTLALRDATFPGLLSLGDPTTSRPGFLHLLGRLKNLKELKGSVHVKLG